MPMQNEVHRRIAAVTQCDKRRFVLREPMPYHSRNPIPPEDLERGRRIEKAQRQIVRDFFEKRPRQTFTPYEVLLAVGADWPITSVRRAMTDLTKENVLTKNEDEQRPGKYGVRNCTWTLNTTKDPQMEMAL